MFNNLKILTFAVLSLSLLSACSRVNTEEVIKSLQLGQNEQARYDNISRLQCEYESSDIIACEFHATQHGHYTEFTKTGRFAAKLQKYDGDLYVIESHIVRVNKP